MKHRCTSRAAAGPRPARPTAGGSPRVVPAILPALVVALLPMGLASCTARVPIVPLEADELDYKLSTHAWMEEGRIATLIVDTRATRDRGEEPYIPLEIVVANNGLRQLPLTRESFTLVDAEGNRHPAAGPREILERYSFTAADRRLVELPGIVANKFAAFQRYPSNFSPDVTNPAIVRDLVSLPKFGYLHDILYFPTPPGGVRGRRFELFVDSPALERPLFVQFEVR